MVKRRTVTQTRHGAGETMRGKGDTLLSPKTPGWKSAKADMFAAPLPTPKSQVGTRRMTRSRASMYQAGNRDLLSTNTSPLSTRSRRSVYVKRLQSPKTQSAKKKKPSRARDLAISESLENIQEKPNSLRVTKSKTVGTRSRGGKRSSDISVDVKISMPGVQNRQSKRAKQSYSDSALLSSSDSTVASTGAGSEFSEASSVLTKKSPRRRSNKTSRGTKSAQKKSHGDGRQDEYTVPDDDDHEISFKKRSPPKKSTSKIPTRSRKSTGKANSSLSFGSISSLESIDISFSKPKLDEKTKKESSSKKTSRSPLRSVSSAESLDINYSTPELSKRKSKVNRSERRSLRPVSSAESVDISYARSDHSRRSGRKTPLRAVSSAESIEMYSSPLISSNRRKGRKPAKSFSDDAISTESFDAPSDLLENWTPFNKRSEADWASSGHDVSNQASFATPDEMTRSSRRSTRDTPRKAVKILGKTTPTSKPIKRIKTPGRLTPGRQPPSTPMYSTRKRRGSVTEFSELPSPKRSRKRHAPPPTFWQTWCTIL